MIYRTDYQNAKKSKEKDDDDSDESDSNATSPRDANLVDSSLPPVDKKQQRLSELQKLKANCKSEEFEKMKLKCEILVRDCIAGLLIQLSNDDFKAMEGKRIGVEHRIFRESDANDFDL